MTSAKQQVFNLCAQVYGFGYPQIIIDLIQDEVEELVNQEEYPRRDQPGALSYQIDILLEVYNPAKEKGIKYLTELRAALDAWSDELESTNIILDLPKES